MLALVIMLLFFTVAAAFAQRGATGREHEEKHERIEAAKVAHITSRLNLSPEQAQKFWPLYNEFSQKRESLRSQQRKLMHGMREKEPSNEEAQNALQRHLRMEREEAALEEEFYGKRVQTVLEARQVVKLMHAEHEFKKMLLQRLKDHRPN